MLGLSSPAQRVSPPRSPHTLRGGGETEKREANGGRQRLAASCACARSYLVFGVLKKWKRTRVVRHDVNGKIAMDPSLTTLPSMLHRAVLFGWASRLAPGGGTGEQSLAKGFLRI